MSIFSCKKCGRSLIEEEEKTHVCKEEILDYKIKGNTLWMFNGDGWFPMELTNRQLTGRNTNREDNRT